MFLVRSIYSIFDAASCLAWTSHVQDSIFLACQIVIIDKKLFEFSDEPLAEVAYMFDVRVAVILLFDCDNTIVPLFILATTLFTFDDADDPALQHATGESRLVHEDKNVDWIAVLRLGGGNKSEIVGEGHARREHFLQLKDPVALIERVLIAALLWCFNDNLDEVIVVRRFETRRVPER